MQCQCHCLDEDSLGLPPGTLHRDQRTTRTLQCSPHSECNNNHYSEYNHIIVNNDHINNTTIITRTTSQRRQYFPKFSEVVFWIALFCSLQVVCKAAPPANRPSSHSLHHRSTEPFWVNPCGTDTSNDVMDPQSTVYTVTDQELIDQIVIQAKTALSDAKNYAEGFVQKNFNAEFDSHHQSWINSFYSWLPNKENIHKNLGEKLDPAYLKRLSSLSESLVFTYEMLQRLAIGIEAVHGEQTGEDPERKTLFSNAEYKLRALLCEMQDVITEKNANKKSDIPRGAMSDELRNLNGSQKDIRDWIIYRDYMNMLEYTIQVFEYHKTALNGAK